VDHWILLDECPGGVFGGGSGMGEGRFSEVWYCACLTFAVRVRYVYRVVRVKWNCSIKIPGYLMQIDSCKNIFSDVHWRIL
jgi:hypothetical protein